MIISRRNQLLAVIATTYILSTVFAEQSTAPKRELKFELSTKSIWFSPCPSETKYAGDLHITKDRILEPWVFGVSETSQWKQMSEAQRQFIIKLQNRYRVTDKELWRVGPALSIQSDYTHTPEGMLTYRVHGVSEEDTRKMAEAVVEWFDNKALEKLEEVQKKLEHAQNVITEAQEKLPKLEVEYQRLQKQADEKEKEYKEVNYIDWEMFDHAENSIEELAHNLRTTDFELAGLQARIDLIGKFKAGGKISDQATMIKLNQMLMADEIERAGVLARRNAYESALKLAKEFRDVVRALRSTSSIKSARERELKIAKTNASLWEKILADPRPEMNPVQVYENKVIIYPVRQN